MARKEFQTLTEQMYYILLVLKEPHHGYEIMQLIDRVSGGRVKVGAGTLYALLGRFEKEGFIWPAGADGRKKIYVISTEGDALLRAEYERLKKLVDAGRPYMEPNIEKNLEPVMKPEPETDDESHMDPEPAKRKAE